MSKAHDALRQSVKAHMNAQGAVAKAAEQLAKLRAEAAEMRASEGEAPVELPTPQDPGAGSAAGNPPAS